MDGLVHDQIRDLDALAVGAGFGVIYMLHKLRNELGLAAVAGGYRSILAAESAAKYAGFTTNDDIFEESAA